MANLLKQNEIDAGGGYITDRGAWQSDFRETVDDSEFVGYALNDIVHTDRGVWLSLVDDNTTNPDEDTTGKWRQFLDKQEAMDFVRSNQPMIGDDGYWYVWSASEQRMVNTHTLARGGEYLIDMQADDCDLVITAATGDPNDIFSSDDCDLVIRD